VSGGAQATAQTKAKTVRTTLDSLPMGDSTYKDTVKPPMPQGVTSRMVYSDIFRIAWPALIELFLTQFVSMADTMMVSQIAPWATAAVGLAAQPRMLLSLLFTAMNTGTMAVASRARGAGDQDRAKRTVRQAIFMTFVISFICSIVGYICATPLVRFMGAADAETLNAGVVYLQIQMLGFVPFALTTTVTAALRAVGNSRTAMIYNLTANLVNVFFNWVLIYGNLGMPRMEVAGASLATIIGQFVAFAIAVRAITKKDQYLRFDIKGSYKPDWEIIRSIAKIGVPAMLEQAVIRTGMIIYTKIIASLGTTTMATHQICMNIQSMTMMLGQAFQIPATSLMGQSLGRKRLDMARIYAARVRRAGIFVSLFISTALIIFGRQLVGLYNDTPEIMDLGAKILFLLAFLEPFASSQMITVGSLRGAGDTKATAMIYLITILLIRPGFAAVAVYALDLGLQGAWYGFMADQFVRSILVQIRFKSGKWQHNGR